MSFVYILTLFDKQVGNTMHCGMEGHGLEICGGQLINSQIPHI